MDILAALGLEVDSRPVARADTALDRFQRSARGAEQRARGFQRAGAGMAAASLRVAAGLGAAAAAFVSLRAAAGAAQAYTEMTNGLRAMGATSAEAAMQLEAVADIAARTRAPLAETAQLYQRISIAGRDLGASQQEVLRFTENIGLALAQTGGSAASASGALLQLSQAMSGGVVRAEEFNSILEGAFPIAQAAANGIDGAAGSVGRLRQMVIEGRVSSEAFFDAILSQSDALERAFASTIPTISQAMQTLGDRITVVVGQFDATAGISAAVARGIMRIADAVQALGQSQAVQLLAENMDRLGYIAATVATIFVGRLVVSIGTAFVAATISAVQQTIALQVALGATSTSAAVAGAAITTLSRGLVLLRGALIATGIGALVVGIGLAVHQFSRMVEATGSVGGAFNMLGDLAREVFSERIPQMALAGSELVKSYWNEMRASFIEAITDMSGRFSQMIRAMAAGMSVLLGPALTSGMVQAADRLSQMAEDTAGHLRSLSDDQRETAVVLMQGATAPLESLQILRDHIAENGIAAMTTEESADALNDALGGLGDPETGGAAAAGKAIHEATTRAEGFKQAMADAAMTAAEFGRNQAGIMVRGVDSIANAFGDFVSRGFRDFRDFASSIVDTFRQMLAQMIALAVRNRIMIGLGFSGGGIAAAGQAVAGGLGGGGGLLGNVFGLGGGGGFLGSFGSGGSILGMGGLSGGTGLLGGLGNALSGGLGGIFNIGANSAGLGLAGSIGAALPVLGLAAAAFSLLRTRTKEVDSGLRITVNEMGVLTEEFSRIKKVRAFGGRSYRTYFSAADAETQSFVEQTVGQLQAGVIASAEALGFAADMFDGFATSFNVSFYGLDDEEAQEALQRGLEGMADRMAEIVFATVDGAAEAAVEGARLTIPEGFRSLLDSFPTLQAAFDRAAGIAGGAIEWVQDFFARMTGAATPSGGTSAAVAMFAKEGEGAYDVLTRLASSLTSVNFWMGNLGLTVQEIGLAGADAASNFVDLFGSIDAFNSAAQSYYQNFYTDAERLRRATELMAVEFANLGIDVMPGTRRQFRDLVDAADAAGDTDLVAALIQLAPAFADITQEANSLNDALNGRSLFRTLADQVYADSATGYRKPISQVLDEAGEETARLLREVITAIREGDLNNARIQSKLLAIQQRADLEPAA